MAHVMDAAAQKTALIVGGAAVVALVLYRVVGKVATETLNPTSDKNAAYQATNGVGAVLTGEPSFDLGFWLYDTVNPDATNPNKPAEPEKTGWQYLGAVPWLIDKAAGMFTSSKPAPAPAEPAAPAATADDASGYTYQGQGYFP